MRSTLQSFSSVVNLPPWAPPSATMSSTESTHPDPGVVPQTSSEVNKGQVDPVKPSQTPGLAKLPTDVKTTISKADEIILRLSK